MKLNPICWLAPLALAAGMAAAQAEDAAPDATTLDTVVATVNGVDITAGEIALMRAQLPQQYQSLPPAALYDGLVQQAISQELLAQTVTDIGRTAELALENENRVLRANIAMGKTAEAAVTDEALKKAYDAEYGSAEPTTEYHAAHILVESEDEAKDIKAQIDGGADFAALAKEHSKDPTGNNGGDLGWFGAGMMVPEFEQAVVALQPGAVSDPVQTQFGWHVVKLIETRDKPVPTLDEVRDELAGQIQQQAVEADLEALRAKATITEADGAKVKPDFLANPDFLTE
ncbi:MAG: peptidylprolyl isomerase [Rhodobacteraceae bacterium]|nr:peptidylprolyl isomerase [Paracoccaceae bacterium]